MKPASLRAVAIAASVLAVLAGLAWVIATQGPLAPVKVTVAQPKTATLAPAVFGIGTVEARRAYAIGPTAAGRLARVLVDQGDRVSPGQLLAEMDPVDLDERVRAALAVAERAADNTRAARSALLEAQSRAKVAIASADRYADLRSRNFVSQEAADAKRHEANAADAGRGAAEASLAAAGDEARRARADLAGLERARAHLRLASPVKGVVAARLAEPGSTVVAGQAVLQVIDPGSLWVRARIDQGRSGSLATGMPAQVVLRSRPGEPLPGRIERLDLVGDAVTEERIVQVGFEAVPAGLVVGEMAEVTLRLPAVEGALAIPSAALKRDGRRRGVWVLDDGRARFRAVTVGAETLDGESQAASGLRAGETVIVHSSQPLAEGLRVKVAESLVKGAP